MRLALAEARKRLGRAHREHRAVAGVAVAAVAGQHVVGPVLPRIDAVGRVAGGVAARHLIDRDEFRIDRIRGPARSVPRLFQVLLPLLHEVEPFVHVFGELRAGQRERAFRQFLAGALRELVELVRHGEGVDVALHVADRLRRPPRQAWLVEAVESGDGINPVRQGVELHPPDDGTLHPRIAPIVVQVEVELMTAAQHAQRIGLHPRGDVGVGRVGRRRLARVQRMEVAAEVHPAALGRDRAGQFGVLDPLRDHVGVWMLVARHHEGTGLGGAAELDGGGVVAGLEGVGVQRDHAGLRLAGRGVEGHVDRDGAAVAMTDLQWDRLGVAAVVLV